MTRFIGYAKFPYAPFKATVRMVHLGEEVARDVVEAPETETTLEADVPGYSVEVFIDAGVMASDSASPPSETKQAIGVAVTPPAVWSMDPGKLSVGVKVIQGVQITLPAPKLSVSVEVSS